MKLARNRLVAVALWLVPAVLCALWLALPAAASADATITSLSGPLTSIGITSDLNCSVNHTGDTSGEFYGDTACGTFVTVGSDNYGPASVPAGNSGNPAYTPVSQTPVTGSGTAGDPYKIVTVVDLGTSGLRLTETDSYVVGSESYQTDVSIHNSGASTVNALLYRAADCYLQDSDTGYGSVDANTGAVACVNAVDDGMGGTMPGTRIEQWYPLSSGSHYYEAGYGEVWEATVAGSQFPDTCRCNEEIDNGAGLSWSLSIPAGGTVIRSNLITFSPLGHKPLATTKTVDSSPVQESGSDGYTITISNPNASTVSLDSITDTLPTGFSYTSGSTTGVTTSNPSVNGQTLTWSGPLTVPAASGGTPGTVALHFGVTVSGTPGTYYNNAGGAASGYTVVATGDTAPVTVTAPPETLTVSKDGTGTGTVTSSPAGINCGASCSHDFAEGTTVTLTPTADFGSTFAGWSGDCTGTGSCMVTMDQAKNVTATFNLLPKHTLTVTNSGTGTGTVTSSPAGINCGSTCSHDFPEGAMVTLTPTADPGSAFTGWSGDCSGTGACTVTMSQARNVTATFAATYTLTVNKAGTGIGGVTSSPAGVDCGGTCSVMYMDGTVVTLAATPGAGSTFGGWSGACSGTGSCTVTMNQAQSVTATFDAVITPPTIGGPGRVGAGDLFCGVKHRGKCKGLKVKGIFDRPGNAVWSFGAYNPPPGHSTASARKFVALGTVKRTIKSAGSVTVVFKLKGTKAKKLYRRVVKLKLKAIRVKLTFVTSNQTVITTKKVKLQR